MSDKLNRSTSDRTNYRSISTGLTLDQFVKQYGSKPPISFARPQRSPSYHQFPYQPEPGQFSTSQPETIKARRPLARRTKKRIGIIASVLAVGSAIVGTGYGFNVGDIQNIMPFSNPGSGLNSELTVAPLQTLGEKSLAPDQCKDPKAVLMIATVSGSLPLAPMLATKDNATPVTVPAYLSKDKITNLTKVQRDKLENFTTKTGYPEATLNDIPLALTICEPTGANAITEQDTALTINRSALEVSFEDPNGLFGTNIYSVLQVDGATDVHLNPAKGEFMSLPDPAHKMFLAPGSDEISNKSLDDMMTSMQNPQQLQVILSKMETGAIQQLDNVVDGHENIQYPSNAKTLQEAIDRALVKRLVGNTKVSPIFTGNYNVQMDVPKDPATKQPITKNDPKTGASPLKYIDPSQKFHISSIAIEYGTITPPPESSKPSPSSSPTTEPSKAP